MFIRRCCKRRVFGSSSPVVGECLTDELLENITDDNGDCITS